MAQPGLNKVMLIGGVGQEPELKHTQGGTAYLPLSIGTNERYKDRDGQWKDRTEWHDVTIWGKRAEGLVKVLTKGSKVYIEGRNERQRWEKDGQKRSTVRVIAKEVILLGGKNKNREGGQRQDDGPPPPDDEDIPF